MADNGISRPAPLNTTRKAPNTLPHEVKPSLSSQAARSDGQVLALAREAMKVALEENQTKAAEASGVSNGLKPGVTIDLSHKQIQRFPDEVVDIIKHELERLALSHNQISTFPARISECTSLRYLNVRNNVIRDFPLSICQLVSLEILDLGRNKLRILPPELAKLTSLKVLSIPRNQIKDLPLFLADMTSLHVLKLEGNPIRFPPKEILQPQFTTPPNHNLQESEQRDITVTQQIKKFLRQKLLAERSETESGEEESSEGTETPRPVKRAISGRFPIKVNGTELPDLRSPGAPRPPPIPSRSHYRGLSQQNAALRRPGVMPLTIGSTNERLRSNSESLFQASRDRTERSLDRSRRMGIVSKKPSELDTVDETKTNRYSHYRGLSHGSAMQGSNGVNGTTTTRGPASPVDTVIPRATYVRRLSSLPERKRESISPDPVIEGAKGILFATFQIHYLIENLLNLTRDGTNKRTSLERVFYNATTHVEELDRDLQRYINYSEEDAIVSPHSNENVHRTCLTCVNAYIHVCDLLEGNVEMLLDNGEPRSIRSFLLLVYGSLAEVRNTSISLFTKSQGDRPSHSSGGTVKYSQRDKSLTPTRERPGGGPRSRTGTVVHHSSNLRVATDAPPPAYLNGTGRSATMTSATPRSGDSFASSNMSSARLGGDFTEEDRIFERVFLRLQQSVDMAVNKLPIVNSHFVAALRASNQRTHMDQSRDGWQSLIRKCSTALQTAEVLKTRLSLIKLKEPGIRTQSAFWELCNSFVNTYTELVMEVKEVKKVAAFLPNEVITILRPLQKSIKETSQLIQASPWSFLTASQPTSAISNSSNGTAYTPITPQIPMTPISAALGPAVQATVPSTPQSATPFGAMFSGSVFDRADALLSLSGSSSASSRAGTMTSSVGQNDGSYTPGIISPMTSLNTRFNSNGKVVSTEGPKLPFHPIDFFGAKMSELTQNTTSFDSSLLYSKIPRKTMKGKEPERVQNYGDIVPLRWSKILASRARKSCPGRVRPPSLPLRPRIFSNTNTNLQASSHSVWVEPNDPCSNVSLLHEQQVPADRELSVGSDTSLEMQSRQPAKSYPNYSGSSTRVQPPEPIALTKFSEEILIPSCTNRRPFPLSRFLTVFESKGNQLLRDLEVHLSKALTIISRIEAIKEAAVSGVPNPQPETLEKWRTHLWEWRTDVGNMARFLITNAIGKIDHEDDAYSYFDLKATSLYFWWKVCKMVRRIVVMTSWPLKVTKMTNVKGTFLMMQRLFGGIWVGLANAFVRDYTKLQKGEALPRDPKSKTISSLIDTGLFNTVPKLWPPAQQKIPRILRRVCRQYSSEFSEYLSEAMPQLKDEVLTLEELKELHRGLLTGSIKIEGAYDKVAKLLKSAPKMLEEFENFIPPNLLPIYKTERDNAIAKAAQHLDEYNTLWNWTIADGLKSLRQSLDHQAGTQSLRATRPEEVISLLLAGLDQASRNVLKFEMSPEISLMFTHLALVMREQNRLYQLCILDIQNEFRDKVPQHVAEYAMEICMEEAINRMTKKEIELERTLYPEICHPVANHSTEGPIERHEQTSIASTARDIWSRTAAIPKNGYKGRTSEPSQGNNHQVEHQNVGGSSLSPGGGALFPSSGIVEDSEDEASDSHSSQLNQV
ncbi:hypothetical protein B7494_g255 [Chlorociboria aeruginascens]|nr:hypothetical protein B7494_g255 [Chlorociboria aeruginascens]